MEKREAARITLEVRERVNARVSNPEDIHLHLQQFGVTPREENVVAGGVAKLFKLAHVVVVTKLDAGIARELATLVEEVGEAFPAVGADALGPGQPSRSRALTVSQRSAERGRPNRFLQKISAVFHVVSYLGDAIKSHASGRVNGSL